MAYGQILQGQVAGSIAHSLGVPGFCVFLVQDIDPVGTARVQQQLYASAQDKNNFTVIDNTPGGCVFDAVAVAPHSMLDVGPIVLSATRTYADVRRGRAPSYRSLQTFPIPCPTGSSTGTITVTHLLGTEDVMVFVQPRERPWDPVAGQVVRFWYEPLGGNINQVALHSCLETGAAFAGVAKQSIYCDVMVVSRRNIGHSTYYSPTNLALARLPSYGMDFTKVNILPGGTTLTHNLRGAAATALIGVAGGGGIPAEVSAGATPVIVVRDVGGTGTQINLSETGSVVGLPDSSVLVMRPYSMYIPA